MARFPSRGEVKVGGNTVAQIISYTLDDAGDSEDVREAASDEILTEFIRHQTSGQIVIYADPADAGQALIKKGDTVALDLYPRGEVSGAPIHAIAAATIIRTSETVDGSLWRLTADYQGGKVDKAGTVP